LITILRVIKRFKIRDGFRAIIALALVAWLAIGCAVKPRFPVGTALLKGETLALPQRPDSVRAELELTVYGGGRKSSVSAAFSFLPRTKYKLDLYGLPGMVAASFLWLPERWTLVLFDKDAFAEDTGEHVEFGNLGIQEVSVHDVFAFIWGDFFPGFSDRGGGMLPSEFVASGPSDLKYTARGQHWKAQVEVGTGLVRGVVREDSAFRMEYLDYKVMASRPVPSKARLFNRTGLLLEIRVKNIEDNPHWRRNPFFIKVPKGFQKLEKASRGAWKD
jgi:hypothetical protein